MIQLKRSRRLKKELRLLDVFAIAAGTTLSAGFFLLPGLAARLAGPAIVIAYLIAAIPLIPAMFSIIELATAMPRAGGVYYFLDRTLGPLFGTISGLGTWLALILKVAFALIGMGAYIQLFIPEISIVPVAVALAVALGILNIFGSKKSGDLQVFLVSGLLIILFFFIAGGIPEIHSDHFDNFLDAGFDNILATAGLVYISYVGVTKVASLSEEIIDPEKNLPRGILLALGIAILIYVLGTAIMVGVLPIEELKASLTPVAQTADILFGKVGVVFLSTAAILAFISVANAGTLSASRYPLAMSRDHIMPSIFRKLGRFGTPTVSLIFTISSIVIILLFLNPLGIAKLASAFQLLMFALVCFAVIVMRESRIESYDPGYYSPFYPWMQIVGIISPLYLIVEMGWLPLSFSLGLILICILWYFYYVRSRVGRTGAIYHIFARLGKQRYEGLDSELRGILKEKGLRAGDPFNEIVMRSIVIDLNLEMNFEDAVEIAAKNLSTIIPQSANQITKQILEGTRVGATPVTNDVALPHFKVKELDHPEMVLMRAKNGIKIKLYDPLTHQEEGIQTVHAIFFLVSPERNPTQHLRMLAQIAGRVDEDNFKIDWHSAKDEHQLKEVLLHNDNFISIFISTELKSKLLVGKLIKDLKLPEECLIAALLREGHIIVPKGNTLLMQNDRITIIGEPKSINELKNIYGE
ncbi:MAG: amino acid permease [Bacteroidetes bacterium]|nr:amino acid permease [Bacteroidota bacterium]